MSSEIPPTYYFSGINYNPDFYQTSSSSYLNYPIAQGTETIKSLRSITVDSTSAATNMSLGSNLTSGSLTIGGSSLHTGTISLGAAQTTGALNIGNGARTGAGAINIGNQAAGNIAITVGTDAKTTTGLKGTVSVSSSMNTTGIIDTGTISTTGNLTSSGLINGSTFQNALNSFTVTGNGVVSGTAFQAGSAITVGGLAGISGGIHVTGEIRSTTGDLRLTTGKLIAGTLDAVADTAAGTTALKIGSNVILGDIEIGNAQTTGDIKIGQSDTSGATITVGTSATATTINGTLTTAIGTISGKTAGFACDTLALTTASSSLDPTTLNLKSVMYFYGAAVPVFPYIILAGGTGGQQITFKNASGYSVTMQFNSNIVLTTATAGVSTTVLAVGSTIDVYYQNGTWYQTNASASLALTTSLTTPSITTPTATALSIGTSTATGVSIGSSTITTTINGALSSGPVFQVPKALSNINYNYGAGASAQTITVPSAGLYIYTFGANWSDANILTTTFVSAGSSTCRLFNQYIPPSFGIALSATGNYTFTIFATSYPASFNTFSVSYVKLG